MSRHVVGLAVADDEHLPVAEEFRGCFIRGNLSGVGCKYLYIKLFPCVRGFVCLYGLCRHIEGYGAGDIEETINTTSRRRLG